MAQNYNRNGSDIPVSKRKNKSIPEERRQPNPYRYEDLLRRENGQNPQRETKTRSQGEDVYINRQRSVQPRQRYEDYRDEYAKSGDIQVLRKKQPMPDEYSKGDRKKVKMPRKRKGKLKKFMSLLMVVAIIYLAVTGYICTIFMSTDYVKTKSSPSTSQVSLHSDPWIKNILLIGVDDKKGGTVSRSDTMILVSVDKKHRQLKMTSFMRDTYVTIPGYGEDKMNAACVYGGPQLVVETIEYNFGIDIDNYVLVDFNAFKDVIDGLGGVTVEVEKKEAEYINRTSKQNIEYGENVTLNGEEALVYVRIRYLDSDFKRTQRQRKVITAIIDEVKRTNPIDLIETGKTVLGYVETDMNPLELTFLAEGAVLSYMRYDIVQSRVPIDNQYTSQTIKGAAVLTIDKAQTSQEIKNFIYNKAEAEEAE